MEDLAAGLGVSESADGARWTGLGSAAGSPSHTDRLHLQLSVSLQHSAGVSLPRRSFQRRTQGG